MFNKHVQETTLTHLSNNALLYKENKKKYKILYVYMQ